MPEPTMVLVPKPVEIRWRDGALATGARPAFSFAGDEDRLRVVAQRLRRAFRQAAVPGLPITLSIAAQAPPKPQGYRLRIDADGAHIQGGGESGVYFGGMTLLQMLRQRREAVPWVEIHDEPDFPVRGFMLDISRDKVPRMETLFDLVRLLASLKFNHLQLYTEHTFAYRRHRTVWADASPMTPLQVQALDAFCREHYIELASNQNCFGHLHRWLKHADYRDLAECPEGYVTPWGERRADPFSVNPLDPRARGLVRELLEELLPNFTSKLCNVGLDETYDLGQGRSKEECERRGKGAVYLEFLNEVHTIVQDLGRTMMFWGDIILHHPELIPQLPQDAIPLVWGYEADHPFADQCARFAAAGRPFYVCPGTSSWCSIGGRTENALANIRSAARAGRAAGAAGFLLTDWGDNGHWQPPAVSYPSLVTAAAHAWCSRANEDLDAAAAMDVHVLRDTARRCGQAIIDLGNTYLKFSHRISNGTPIFRLLLRDQPQELLEKLSEDELRGACDHIAGALRGIEGAAMQRGDADLVLRELNLAAQFMIHACARGLAIKQGRPLHMLAEDMRLILQQFHRVWMARNRMGGLRDSARVLERRLSEYTAP